MRKSNLKGHIKTQHKGLCFSCDQCDSKTQYPAKLKIHIEFKHKGIRHRCDQCNFKALRKEQLKLQIEIKHDGIWYNCNECEYTTSKEHYYKSHISLAHKGSTLKDSSKPELKCDKCDYKTTDSFNMNIHINEVHKEQKIKCHLCDFRAKDKEVLKKHHIVAMGHKKNNECFFFVNKGFCRNGEFCRFKHESKGEKHDMYQNISNYKWQSQEYISRDSSVKRQCKYKESCFQFPNCHFQHNEVCRYQNNCFFQDNCKYVHFTQTASNSFLGMLNQNNKHQMHY